MGVKMGWVAASPKNRVRKTDEKKHIVSRETRIPDPHKNTLCEILSRTDPRLRTFFLHALPQQRVLHA